MIGFRVSSIYILHCDCFLPYMHLTFILLPLTVGAVDGQLVGACAASHSIIMRLPPVFIPRAFHRSIIDPFDRKITWNVLPSFLCRPSSRRSHKFDFEGTSLYLVQCKMSKAKAHATSPSNTNNGMPKPWQPFAAPLVHVY